MEYSLEVLKSEHKQLVQPLMAKAYVDHNPYLQALLKFNPELKQSAYELILPSWSAFVDEGIKSQMSTVAFNKQTYKVIGALLVFDICNQDFSVPQELLENPLVGPIFMIFDKLKNGFGPEYQKIFTQKGITADVGGVFIAPEYQGKHILSQLSFSSFKLGLNKNFKNGSCTSINLKSSAVLKKLGFEKIHQIDSHQLIWKGEKVFKYIDEEHRYPSLWFKSV